MKAAVLHDFGQSPRYEDFADPQATEGEVLVRIKAASLKNVDKMMANGSHYDRFPDLPCVRGVDGAGLLDAGTRLDCVGARTPYGMTAERNVVPRGGCPPVPEPGDYSNETTLPYSGLTAWLTLAM